MKKLSLLLLFFLVACGTPNADSQIVKEDLCIPADLGPNVGRWSCSDIETGEFGSKSIICQNTTESSPSTGFALNDIESLHQGLVAEVVVIKREDWNYQPGPRFEATSYNVVKVTMTDPSVHFLGFCPGGNQW